MDRTLIVSEPAEVLFIFAYCKRGLPAFERSQYLNNDSKFPRNLCNTFFLSDFH